MAFRDKKCYLFFLQEKQLGGLESEVHHIRQEMEQVKGAAGSACRGGNSSGPNTCFDQPVASGNWNKQSRCFNMSKLRAWTMSDPIKTKNEYLKHKFLQVISFSMIDSTW